MLRMMIGGDGSGGISTDTISLNSASMTQRNAILRSLVGPALHGMMDKSIHDWSSSSTSKSLGWSGGLYSTLGSAHGTSVQAAINAASLTQWMSVAHQLLVLQSSAPVDEMVKDVLTDLAVVLETSSFVVPYAATATIADLDLCMALLQVAAAKDVLVNEANVPLSVRRWMKQVVAVVLDLLDETGLVTPAAQNRLVLPDWLVKQSRLAMAVLQQAPIVFTGTENANEVLAALYKSTASTMAPGQSKAKPSNEAKTTVPTISAEGAAATTTTSEKKGKMTKQEKKAALAAEGG
jgi:hypothetical protein